MLGFVMKSGIFPMYMQKSLFVATNVVEGDQIKRVDIHSRSETEAAVFIHVDTFTKGTRDHHDCILALWGLLNLISFALRSS